MKFRRGKRVSHEPCIKRGRSPSDGGRVSPGVAGAGGRMCNGSKMERERSEPLSGNQVHNVNISLREGLTDCVHDSEQQDEGIEIEESGEYEFEYSLLRSPKK